MKVRVKLFAAARQAAGRHWVDLELPEGATVAQLRRELARQITPLSDLVERLMFAIDADYADDSAEIGPGADVACIPPVSGG